MITKLKKMPDKAIYLGWLGKNNLGDETLWQAFKEMIPGAKSFAGPSGTRIRMTQLMRNAGMPHLSEALRHWPLRRILDGSSEQPIFLGGGTLIGAKMWLPMLQDALARGFRLISFGSGVMDMTFWAGRAGYPVDTQTYFHQWQEVLKQFQKISVRGVHSQKLLNEIGVSSEVVGDPATQFVEEELTVMPEKKIIGLNWGDARSQMWGDKTSKMEDILRIFCNQLTRSGWKVCLFSIYPPDTKKCKQWILTLDEPSKAKLIVEYASPRRFISCAQQCDVFVGMKLHATALAFVGQVPSIMLEYRPKCADFMDTMEAAGRSVRCDRLTLERLQDLFENTYDNRKMIQRHQQDITLAYRNRLRHFMENLF